MTKTLYDVYIEIKNTLGSELESREICAFALGLDRNKTLDWAYLYIGDESRVKIQAVVDRRLTGEPLAYILGEWEFYSLPFKMSPKVLIPRADTEILVDGAIRFLDNVEKETVKVLDLCCGTGCISIAILKNVENSKVIACDISKDAVDLSRFNAKLNDVHKRYMAVEYDIFAGINALGKFDLIVSNPPYIKNQDIQELDIDVKDFEPHLALDGGEDGYDFYRAILQNFIGSLNENGRIMFEYGIGQEQVIGQMMYDYGLKNIRVTKDLCGINRVIEATKISS